MEIVNNINNCNHLSYITNYIQTSQELILVSPFLMEDFSSLFSNPVKRIEKLIIITTLKNGDLDQIKKIKSFKSIVKECEKYNIDYKIYINNRLHGKIYIAKSDITIKALVTSANLTNKGLSQNHEWGIEINDKEAIKIIEKEIFTFIDEYSIVSKNDIDKLSDKINEYLEKHPRPSKNKIELNLSDLLDKTPPTLPYQMQNNRITFWLKPIGVSGNPVSLNFTPKYPDDNLHFAKPPKGIKGNDIIITYAVKHKKILAIFRVTKPYEYDPNVERWPWFMNCENITPNFSKSWINNNLTISDLGSIFKKNHPQFNLTMNSKSLGGLNFGSDKLRLSKAFSAYIINKVLAIEEK